MQNGIVVKSFADILYFGTTSKYMYRIDNASVGDPPKTILSGPPTGSNSFTADIAINPNNGEIIVIVSIAHQRIRISTS